GLPSIVIMKLNPQRVAAVAAPAAVTAVGNAGAPNVAAGNRLYSQVCVSCHGPDGNMLADHKLGTLASRFTPAATIAYIKDPKSPMPKLYPDLINEQSVIDVAAYLHRDLAR
ncbi:MAG: cytochrome c, partial [Pseudomonadota bacterium]